MTHKKENIKGRNSKFSLHRLEENSKFFLHRLLQLSYTIGPWSGKAEFLVTPLIPRLFDSISHSCDMELTTT